MNRYEDSRPNALLQENDSLSVVRTGLTAAPQNSLADFRVRPTSYGLEVQFCQKRIRDRLVFKPKDAAKSSLGLSLRSMLATVTLVGGAVALTSSAIFGAVVASALPIAYKLVKPTQKESDSEPAVLRFVNAPNGRTLLSMTTAPNAQRKHPQPKRDIHFSNRPVQLISASTYLFGGQLSVTLYESDRNGRNKLRITGSHQEIRWLHAKISNWNNMSKSHP